MFPLTTEHWNCPNFLWFICPFIHLILQELINFSVHKYLVAVTITNHSSSVAEGVTKKL